MNDLIEKLVDLEKQITELFEEKTKLLQEFSEEYPEKFACKQNEDGTWTRLTLSDNAEKIDEGFWKTVRVERYSLKIETLKNMPKELKG